MCTVSWLHHQTGYSLFCNRDEQRSRPAAQAPVRRAIGGMCWVAPLDPQGGGTWIAANQHGIALCLLNWNVAEGSPRARSVSRGRIIPQAIFATTLDEVESRLSRLAMSDFPPFTMLGLAPLEPALIARWDGRSLALKRHEDAHGLLCSSSFDEAGASIARRKDYCRHLQRTGLSAETLAAFHRSHEPEIGAYSTCMHRDDAETVSFTRLEVSDREVVVRYSPGAPCLALPEVQVELARMV
jgi:hypothetical protein